MLHRIIPVALLLLVVPTAPLFGQELPEVDLVAYVPDIGAEISADEVKQHIQLYATFLEDRGLAHVKVTVVETVQELESFVTGRSADRPAMGVIHPMVASMMGDSWGIRPFAAPIQEGSALAGRVVVSLRGSKVEKLSDLEGKSLVITRPWEELPELLGLLLFGEPVRADERLGKLLLAETSAQAAAVVLQRKADAALLNPYVYHVSAKQNRRVWQNLQEVGETEPAHLSLVVSFTGFPADLEAKIQQAILTASDVEAGRELLEAFKLDGFQAVTAADLARVEGKMLTRLRTNEPAAGGLEIEATRMADGVGLTLHLVSPLADGESAVLSYRLPGADETRVTLRCLTLTCTGVAAIPAGTRVEASLVATGDGPDRSLGKAIVVAP